MLGPVYQFLADDHVRLDALMRRAVADPVAIDLEAYEQFRAGLLLHIAMEEKVLLPDARCRRGGEPLPVAKQLRTDHAALTSLLVPTPTHAIIATISDILVGHNQLEEEAGGAYVVCEDLAGQEEQELLARLRAVPAVPLAPHHDGPRVHMHIAELMRVRAAAAGRSDEPGPVDPRDPSWTAPGMERR